MGPGEPCRVDCLLEGLSLEVELLEKFVPVAMSIDVGPVLVLEGLKRSEDSITLGLDVAKQSSGKVSTVDNESIDGLSEGVCLVGGTVVLRSDNLISECCSLALLEILPLSKPFEGAR